MNIEIAIKNAYKELKKNKISSALLDSELLLSQVIKKDRKFILLNLDKELDENTQNSFRDLILKRSRGKPLAYLTGIKSFWKYDFDVNEKVLIPRPETEIIVDYVNNHFPSSINVLDAGTGSGCIGISIALQNPSFKVYGSDYSEDAIDIAFTNKNNLDVKNFSPILADWLSCFKTKCFDLIVSNPPYIAEGDSHLEKLIHEPKIALVSKENGLLCIKKIVEQSNKILKNGGTLIIEHGYQQQNDVEVIFKRNKFSKIINLKDLQSLPRITIGTLEK